MHTRHRRPARLLHEQKGARTSALHLHGRLACADPRCSCSSRLTPSCGPLDGRLAPSRRLAPTARRRRRAALSAARGPMAAAAAAAAAELLGPAPTMAAAADKEPVRVERETPIAAPPGFRQRPHGRTPAESTERGGARGGLAACRHRRMVALARGRLTSCPGTRRWPEFCAPGGRAASRRRARTATRLRAPGRNRCR